MKKVLFSLLTIFIATISYAAPAKLEVVASFSILSDLTREVGGDRVNVYSLVPAGRDAHVYQPTPSDIKKVKTAQVFVSNGLGFEGWQSRILGAANFKGPLLSTMRFVLSWPSDSRVTSEQKPNQFPCGPRQPSPFSNPLRFPEKSVSSLKMFPQICLSFQ